jgi:hypothetical protein
MFWAKLQGELVVTLLVRMEVREIARVQDLMGAPFTG